MQEFLHYSKTFSKFKHITRKFKRLKVRSLGNNHIWSMDVAFMEKPANQNNGYRYLVIAVDVLSRFVRVQPIKSKSSTAVKEAFCKMLTKEPGKFSFKIWTDNGSKLRGEFKKFCDQNQIEIYHTLRESNSSLAERCIRTLKTILYKVFSEGGSYKHIHLIQKLVKKLMNSRINRSIGMAPVKVIERERKKNVADAKCRGSYTLEAFTKNMFEKAKFTVGDSVHTSNINTPFKKRYKQKHGNEVFKATIVARPKSTSSDPVSYPLQGFRGDKNPGRFYNQEFVAFQYDISQHRWSVHHPQAPNPFLTVISC